MVVALRPDKEYELECSKGRMELRLEDAWPLPTCVEYFKGSARFVAQKGQYYHEAWVMLEK